MIEFNQEGPPAPIVDANVDYFGRKEVSNSDLSWLRTELLPEVEKNDFTNAYRMGSLIDAMITEPERINYFKFQLKNYPAFGHDEQFTTEEFAVCELMKKAFRKDEFCVSLLRQSTGQMVKMKNVALTFDGLEFFINMRCKYDLWSDILKWGGDIKSTTATTQKQFEDAAYYFDYDRQRAGYMNVSDAPKDMLIGISKVNYKIFKIPISRESDFYKSGMAKLNYLGFRWWSLFEGLF